MTKWNLATHSRLVKKLATIDEQMAQLQAQRTQVMNELLDVCICELDVKACPKHGKKAKRADRKLSVMTDAIEIQRTKDRYADEPD